MPCYSQQLAVRMPGRTQNGKQPLKFIGKANSWWVREHGAPTNALLLPCRQCIGCRLEKSRQWATRLLHETKFHENSCFLTLTYDDDHVPENGTLIKDHLRTFFKDLRSRLDYYEQEKIKYFACGEYGDETSRPHYHAAIFGGPFKSTPELYDYSDHSRASLRVQEEPARSGMPQWSHPDIGAVWTHGRHRLSELSFESAAYLARYVLKKISGVKSASHYGTRQPEFQCQSHGLGKAHLFDREGNPKWLYDVYPGDRVVLPGRGSFLPPPYYDRLLEKADPKLFAQVKKARQEGHEKMNSDMFLDHVTERDREGQVRQLVTDATLIRGVL